VPAVGLELDRLERQVEVVVQDETRSDGIPKYLAALETGPPEVFM